MLELEGKRVKGKLMAPKWAQELLIEVCTNRGVEVPELRWRRSAKHFYSSGHCYWSPKTYLVVTAGKDRTDQKLVLLHEIAHHLNPRQHHTAAFWDTAWELYREYKLPIRATLKREANYKEAITAYKRSQVAMAACPKPRI